jgi:hypothetical protein
MTNTPAVDTAPPLVLCIPGPWPDHHALVRDVALHASGYLLADRVLTGIGDGFACAVSHETPDADLAAAFAAAGPYWVETAEMQRIAGHVSVVYLEGHGGSRANAESMMRAAAAIVRAGGLGVKVESAGVAHPPAQWLDLVDKLDQQSAHWALVVYLADDNEVVTCGMHNFGCRDASVAGPDPAEGVAMLRAFTQFLFETAPELAPGQTFADEVDGQWVRIEDDPAPRFAADSPMRNPYGTWRLVPFGGPAVAA